LGQLVFIGGLTDRSILLYNTQIAWI